MTDLYDERVPFLVRIRFSQEWLGRFQVIDDANQFAETAWAGYDTEVIDTTPKPKIPEDAEFIYCPSWSGSGVYARRIGHVENRVWETSNPISRVDESELLERIGDAEVTVLVRKDKS